MPNSNFFSIKKKSLLQFIGYTGPAILVSMAYMDPGNYGTDIQAGSSFNYDLLWIVWLSSGMAMLLQYLSGKLGISTGFTLPELIRKKFPSKYFIIPYWLGAEAASAATDLAEYLGTVIALNLLFGIPMIYAAIIGAVDTVLILALATQRKFHLIERLFIVFVSIIGFGYIYDLFVVSPDPYLVVYHSFVPSLTTSNSLFLVVGIIGATVMPHALFLHSWLTKNKSENKSILEKRRLRKYHLLEIILLLTMAGFVNAAILIMAAAAFYPHSTVSSISEAYRTLIPLFGTISGIVFVFTLLSSGIASSVVGTLAGQVIMEGLLGKKVNVWFRRFVTRFINVIPTTIAIFLGIDPLNILVYSQVILSIMLPLPMIPLIIFTRDRNLMGEFVNRRITNLLALLFVGIIIVFNSYLLIAAI